MMFRKLSVQFVLAALLPIVFVSGVLSVPMIIMRREQMLEQAELRAVQAGKTAEVVYAERLDFATLLVELLADRPVLVNSISTNNDDSIRDFVRQTYQDTLFDLVTITSANATVLAQEGNTALWRADMLSTTTPQFWGQPDVGMVVQIARAIPSSNQQSGFIVGTFVIDNALLAYTREQTDLDQSILFGDQLVASSHADRAALAASSLPPQVRAQVLGLGLPVAAELSLQGTPYLANYTPLRAPDQRIVGAIEVLLPLDPVRQARHEATILLLSATLLATASAAMIGALLAGRLSRPIRQLGSATQAIGFGRLDQPVMVRGPQEIEQLSGSIEEMRQALQITHSALAAEKTRYATIVESVEESIITLDARERITMINSSAETLLGIEQAAALGHTLSDIVPLRQEKQLTLAMVPPHGTVRLAVRTLGNRELVVAVTRSPLRSNGSQISEHVVVLRDVSEETALVRLKEEFLANITHEFRTPLAALVVSLEILREDSETLLPAERQQMLNAVHVGVHRLDSLVQNLLDSASLQAGYFRIQPDISQLPDLIKEALETMAPLLQQREQVVRVSMPASMPPVLADEPRIVQVFTNLLSNASKFGPRGDTLEIAVDVHADHVAIGVTDHGPGIPASRQATLFERFTRPGAETIKAQGVGLGLAIVKAIIERHGGRIALRSSETQGATFQFTLPLAQEPRMNTEGTVV